MRRVDGMCIEVFIRVGDIMAVDRMESFDRYNSECSCKNAVDRELER